MALQHPISASSAHLDVVTDYQPTSYFRKKAQRLHLTPHAEGKEVHVFRVICSDSRGRSQRLVNAAHVLHEMYRKNGNNVHTHTMEVAGATLFPDQTAEIRKQMIGLKRKYGDKVEFKIEIVGHSGIINRESDRHWATDKSCAYHCGFTHGDTVAKELEDEIIENGGLRAGGKNWAIQNTTDLRQFMEMNYGFRGPFSGKNNQGAYIWGIPDPKDHVIAQYHKVMADFKDLMEDGVLSEDDVSAGIHDFRDHHYRVAAGARGGWTEMVHRLAELDEGEIPYSKRHEKQSPTIMAITNPDVVHRSTVPLAAIENLGPEYAPGMVFVNAIYGLDKGMVGPSTQAATFYFAKHLGGRVLHIRGNNAAETRKMVEAIRNDPIMTMIIRNYGLKVVENDHTKEKAIIAAMHGKAA